MSNDRYPRTLRGIVERLGTDEPFERWSLGQSNEVWASGEVVIRLSLTGDWLITEAKVLRALPPEVGYPRIIDAGDIDGRSWIATERLPGLNLAEAWPRLGSGERASAVRDLWGRLEWVHATDVGRLPDLPPTPIYSFDPDVLAGQLDAAGRILGAERIARLQRMIMDGIAATEDVPRALVHTDAGLNNTVWDGRSAVPVDFEFAWIGPVDLDLDRPAREIVTAGDGQAIAALRRLLDAVLHDEQAITRLRYYTVSWNLWALGKWLAKDPAAADALTWGPTLELLRDCQGKTWIDELLGS